MGRVSSSRVHSIPIPILSYVSCGTNLQSKNNISNINDKNRTYIKTNRSLKILCYVLIDRQYKNANDLILLFSLKFGYSIWSINC